MDEDFRFVPKRARHVRGEEGEDEDEDEDHPSGLSQSLRDALDSYRPIGGRVEGTDNLLLNFGFPGKAATNEGKRKAEGKEARSEGTFGLDDDPVPSDGGHRAFNSEGEELPGYINPETGFKEFHPESDLDETLTRTTMRPEYKWDEYGDAHPDSAQNVIRRNIDNFLRNAMNRYVLNHRDKLFLDDRDVEQVQKNIITYWLNKHKRVRGDPLYNFVEMVAGMLDEKVEFLLANARSDRQSYGTSRQEYTGRQEKGNKTGVFHTGVIQGSEQDAYINEQQYLLKTNSIVREAVNRYAENKIDGISAAINADEFMQMLQDFEISGHIEISAVVTNAWKAVHSEISSAIYKFAKFKTGTGMNKEEEKFYTNIKNPRIREAYARATAAQMMLYRQLDKRRSYLAVDYERVTAHLAKAKRDVVDAIRWEMEVPILADMTNNEYKELMHKLKEQECLNEFAILDPDLDAFLQVVAGVSDQPVDALTVLNGQPTRAVKGVINAVFSQVCSKRGIVKALVTDVLYKDAQLRNTFGQIVGMTLQVQGHTTNFKRGASNMQRAMIQRNMNAVWTDMLMALKNAGLLTVTPRPSAFCSF